MTIGELRRVTAKAERLPNGCWQWRGSSSPSHGQVDHRYAKVRYRGRVKLAHRVLYEGLVGPIPEGLTLDHLCRNSLCVNPAHMEITTLRENILRGNQPPARNARKTHCKHGHPLSGANVRHHAGRTERVCRTCEREYGRRRRGHL